jgi:hypothetical protein
VNAAFSAPQIDVILDNNTIQSGLAFENNSGYLPESSGSRTLQLNQSGTSTVLSSQSVNLNDGTDTTVIASTPISGFTVTQTVLTDDNSAPSSGNIKIRIANSSQAFTSLDVYIVAPGTNIAAVAPTIGGVTSMTASAYQNLQAAAYEIFVTPHGQKAILVDSGAITFSAGQIRTFVDFDLSNGISFVLLSDAN